MGARAEIIGVRLNTTEAERLRELSAATGQNQSAVLRQLIGQARVVLVPGLVIDGEQVTTSAGRGTMRQ